jgi:hypothetical protein
MKYFLNVLANYTYCLCMKIPPQIRSWSRWLTDRFAMGSDDSERDGQDAGRDGDDRKGEGGLGSFKLLNELSDLLMLPKDMLLENSIRKEV